MKQHKTASSLYFLTVSGIIGSLVGCSPEQTLATPPANTSVSQGGSSAAESSSSTATGGQGYPTAGGTTSESSSSPSQGGTNAAGGTNGAGGTTAANSTTTAGGAATGGTKAATGGTKAATGGTGTKAATGGKTGAGGTKAATGGVEAGGDTSANPAGGVAATGGSAAAATTAAANTGTTVTFNSSGKAIGAMTGWAFVAAGATDVITSPTCGSAKTTIKDTATTPCSESLNWAGTTGLCMTGTVPIVDDPGYKSWGMNIGVNAAVPDTAPLGQTFSTITLTYTGTPSTGLNALISVGKVDYCVNGITSGKAITLSTFAIECYNTPTGAALTAADVPKITKVQLQVSAGAAAITVTDLCLTQIKFGT